MKTSLFVILLLVSADTLFAQEKKETGSIIEQQLENEIEQGDNPIEDDLYWQQLEYYQKHPVNINTVEEEQLRSLNLLTEIQIASIMRYRKFLGVLLNIYELQAIPGLDILTIKKILPFITVRSETGIKELVAGAWYLGEHGFMTRITRAFHEQPDNGQSNKYLGNLFGVQVRYKYKFKDKLQWGLTGDKDAGEPVFNRTRKTGFDFYSFHFFAGRINKIKAFALGDFTINMGQGLIQWQSLAFRKNSAVLNIKRQGNILKPYNSAGEFNFHRGVGITLQQNKWELTLFSSFRKHSANVIMDSIQNKSVVSSLVTSGYHRTAAELADKNSLHIISFGGNTTYKLNKGHVGINAISYFLSVPIQKKEEPYNLFSVRGNRFSNYSIDYSYTIKNMHVFGEAALNDKGYAALVTGMVASLDPRMDISLLYRRIDKKYYSMFSNAFTKRSTPVNENGLYGAIVLKPVYGWQLNAYADIYRFPWLSAQIDKPAFGKEYFIQLTYTPSKNMEMLLRYRTETSPDKKVVPDSAFGGGRGFGNENWRIQVNHSLSKSLTLRTRVEWVRTFQGAKGFSGFIDIAYTPWFGFLNGNLRLQYFETDDYESRIYAFENDVLYTYSIPAFYKKGIRYYLNNKIAFKNLRRNKNLINISVWVKMAQTVDFKRKVQQTNTYETINKSVSEIRFQLIMGCQKINK